MNQYKKSIKVVNITDERLMKPLDECEFDIRVMNCLKDLNLTYLEEVTALSERELLRTPNLGRKSLNRIKEMLAENAMSLGNGVKKEYLVISTTNTFEVVPGKTYSRADLYNLLESRGIEFHIIPRSIRNAERLNAVRELV